MTASVTPSRFNESRSSIVSFAFSMSSLTILFLDGTAIIQAFGSKILNIFSMSMGYVS